SSIYGAIREQIEQLNSYDISWDICPGVSSFLAAAAAAGCEYTVPGISQSLIITRMEGRTPVPEKEKMRELAGHNTSMAVFLSSGLTKELQDELLTGGYSEDTPCAICYKVSWPDEKIIMTTIKNLHNDMVSNSIAKTALILVGDFLGRKYNNSKLYDASFTTEYRK
ncbi:MAG: cobalt-precorrin-4/precorrin-4 C(11)-methyltransferase, partial [Lachnospira sp.]|nr:cobalt-precorrin-4/precorrin-4 C(11)-methyltransferase [Lachnospira sp.]